MLWILLPVVLGATGIRTLDEEHSKNEELMYTQIVSYADTLPSYWVYQRSSLSCPEIFIDHSFHYRAVKYQ